MLVQKILTHQTHFHYRRATSLALEATTTILLYYRFVINEMVCEFLITISF